MYKDLEEELTEGKRLAEELAKHLEDMGNAAKVSIPVMTDSGCYIVEVRRTI